MSRMIYLRFLGLFVVMLTMFCTSALANNDKDYYSKITAKAVGEGKVYVSYNTTANPSASQYASTSSAESGKVTQKDPPMHNYYLYA